MLPPLASAAELPGTPSASACATILLGTAASAAVVDGRTLKLEDGRELRLAGIELPSAPNTPEQSAVSSLRGLIAGRTITLRARAESTDRYGRLIAFAFIEGIEGRSLQEELVLRGQALVSPRISDPECYKRLRAAEQSARARKLGLWAAPGHNLRAATNLASLRTELGRFAIVEGRVLSVREARAMIYLNFGRRWDEDFTVAIKKRNEPLFLAALRDLKRLEGRVVRIRGWLEARGGPWIEADHPNQIEIVGSWQELTDGGHARNRH